MKILHLLIRGRVPSKKNSTRNFGYKRLPSLKHQEWEEHAAIQLFKHRDLNIQKVARIQLEFAWPDKRKADLTNKAESVMDLLVKLNVIEDDNWKVVPDLQLKSLGLNRQDPGVEIWIEYNDKIKHTN